MMMKLPISKNRRLSLAAFSLAAIVGAGLLASCAPFATYPPVEGAKGIDNPAWEPVPSIMAAALRNMHARYGAGHEEFFINLPAGTPAKVYDKVIEKLGTGVPMTSPGQYGYHIVQIRSRGLGAEADVIHVRDNGFPAMVTLHMQQELGGYVVESAKAWNYLQVALPEPHYVPEPVEDAEENDSVIAVEPTDSE